MDSSVIEILKRQQILETFKSSGYEKTKQKSTPHNTVRIFSESAGHLPLNETNTGKAYRCLCFCHCSRSVFRCKCGIYMDKKRNCHL